MEAQYVTFSLIVVGIIVFLAILWLCWKLIDLCLGIPMRRRQRAQLFIDVLETGIKSERSAESIMRDLIRRDERTMGYDLKMINDMLDEGASFAEALAAVPYFPHPKLNAILRAGYDSGRLKEVFGACRRVVEDDLSRTRGAQSYLMVLVCLYAPFNVILLLSLYTFVVPKYVEIMDSLQISESVWITFLMEYGYIPITALICLAVLLLGSAFFYIAQSRVWSVFGFRRRPVFADYIAELFPWFRLRGRRDFAAVLAVLLDSGMPEADSIKLAADGVNNKLMGKRAAKAVSDLESGAGLVNALGRLGDKEEFTWRFRAMTAGRPGTMREKMEGWLEMLDAKSFQYEQAGAHILTTAAVLLNGAIVGGVVIAIFQLLVKVIEMGVSL
ncbi:MAG: type II secretion system F family protein [Verrucomicrobia bacterium]|nr:type II secretion system F family protein [Verrucomicrobiota bacterium]